MWVSAEFFRLWNLRPLLGRTFTDDEGQPGKDDVLVISHSFWKSSFGGDPDIIGRMVNFQERPMTIIGVMPPYFSFPITNYKYWRPVQNPDPATSHPALQFGPNLKVIAKMQPGVELPEVQAFLDHLVVNRLIQAVAMKHNSISINQRFQTLQQGQTIMDNRRDRDASIRLSFGFLQPVFPVPRAVNSDVVLVYTLPADRLDLRHPQTGHTGEHIQRVMEQTSLPHLLHCLGIEQEPKF